MALVKVKPTSPGRRGMVKVVHADLYKGRLKVVARAAEEECRP